MLTRGRSLQLAGVAVLAIHAMLGVLEPPARYPHLFHLVITSFSCVCFCLADAYCTAQVVASASDSSSSSSKRKPE